jgi:YHS domain-containing protein
MNKTKKGNKMNNEESFKGKVFNYTGDPNPCDNCKTNLQNLDYLYVIEPVVGGGEQYLFCNENCMNSYDVSTSTKYEVS